MERTGFTSTRTRRRVLAGVAAGTATLAGCLGSLDANEGPPEEELATDYDVPLRGDADGDVTLAVYEDFACPHCRTYNEELRPELEAEYLTAEPVRYEHRDFPIPVRDPESWEAASAARAIYDRSGNDDFWAYAASLFEHQDRLGDETPELYGDLAEELDLDGGAIQTAAVEREYDDIVGADRQRGIDAGVEATPSFVVDGDVVASGSDEETLDTVRAELDARLDGSGGSA